ncbi:MAG: MltA domain-containing protein [Rhodospirillales bacterium]|nr:MltA domain-containing protein [Rhodospirillales bacterium]
MRRPGFLLAALALILSACALPPSAPVPPKLTLLPARYADLAGWSDDRQGEALAAFKRSCGRLASRPENEAVGPSGLAGTVRDWRAVCAEATALSEADDAAARAFFESRFLPLAATDNGNAEGLFTGYYEPELRGARRPGGRFTVPLYGRPADLVTVDLGQFREEWRGQTIAGRIDGGRLRPYASRTEIEGGALCGRRLELVWVDDAVDAFFLHIQGSGRVVLDDGSVLRVGYAAQNGHPYFAIGRELVARGVLTREEVSLQSIRAWLAAHPDEAAAVMNKNPSFVFFRALGENGPLGAEGVALTPGRSLAVDRAFFPFGLPLWLDAEDPVAPAARVRRLMVAQDTGGAIRGPVRGDVFWGHGDDAAERAGRMRSAGRYWVLLPREVAARRMAGN